MATSKEHEARQAGSRDAAAARRKSARRETSGVEGPQRPASKVERARACARGRGRRSGFSSSILKYSPSTAPRCRSRPTAPGSRPAKYAARQFASCELLRAVAAASGRASRLCCDLRVHSAGICRGRGCLGVVLGSARAREHGNGPGLGSAPPPAPRGLYSAPPPCPARSATPEERAGRGLEAASEPRNRCVPVGHCTGPILGCGTLRPLPFPHIFTPTVLQPTNQPTSQPTNQPTSR